MKLHFDRQALDIVLTNPNFESPQLLHLLNRDFGKIYLADAGVREKYTIGQHTTMVMNQFEKYFSATTFPMEFSRETFRFFLALHDIGKPEAIRRGDKNQQHFYTKRLMSEIFTRLNFSATEIKIAQALVSTDCLGKYIRGNISAKDTAEIITGLAQEAGLKTKDFFDLLTIFFCCDAGSYTEDAGGFKSLEHLFIFKTNPATLLFSKKNAEKINDLHQYLTCAR